MSESFQLNTERRLVRSADLAKAVARRTGEKPVSSQTIANWAERGVVTVAETGEDGTRWFDLDTAVDEAVANRPSPRHGGARRNAGRKPDEPAADPAIRAAADAGAARDTVRARHQEDANQRPPNAVPLAELANITLDELQRLIAFVGVDALGISQVGLERLEYLGKIKAQQRAEAEQAGRLVRAEDLQDRWNEALRRIARIIESTPARVIDALLPLAYPSPEQVDRMIRKLKELGADKAMLDAARDAVSVPPELSNRLLSVVRDEIRGTQQAIVDEFA